MFESERVSIYFRLTTSAAGRSPKAITARVVDRSDELPAGTGTQRRCLRSGRATGKRWPEGQVTVKRISQSSRVIAGTPFFYGWLILGSATVSLFMTLPGQTAGVAAFLDQIIITLDIERTTVLLPYLIGNCMGAVSLTFVGWGIDRSGRRIAAPVITILFVTGCLVMSLASGSLTLLVGLFLLRAFGQGGLPLAGIHTVNLWFVSRRGMAVGLADFGVALGTTVFPPFYEYLMGSVRWRVS